MLFKPSPSSGVPIYLQLMEQVKHSVATGVLMPGDQLPGIRRVAEDLVMNPNTVAKAYRELEHEGVIELRHGAGAFIVESESNEKRSLVTNRALSIIQKAIEQLDQLHLGADEVRRLFEGELLKPRPLPERRSK